MKETDNKKVWTRKEIIHEVLEYSKVIIFAVAFSFLLNKTLITNAQVTSGSMENTVMTGSRVFVNRQAYLFQDPQRGDIISFYYPDDGETEYMKRIVGLPGETIEGRDGAVYIDGVMLEEPYIREVSYEEFGPYEIPEDAYFMMGDNRTNSWDSRYWLNKFLHREAIIGKAEFEYYPEIKSFH